MERTSEKRKTKVSWANICQVKVFLEEEAPCKVGSHESPNHSSLRKPEEPDLPPGFESYCAIKSNVSNIPQVKWKQPLKFSLDPKWLVEAGGESTERKTQNLRNSKLLEAIYPYPSTIPSQPAVSQKVEAEHFDDSKTPVIPIIEIEDKSESKEESSSSHNTAELGFSALRELASSLAPILSMLEKEPRVDPDLLVKILSDPEMVKKLLTGTTGVNQPLTNPDQSIVASHHQPLPNVEQRIVASHHQPLTNVEQRILASHHQPLTNVDQRIVASHHQPLTNVEQRIVASHHQPLTNVDQRIVASHHQPLPNVEQRIVASHHQPLPNVDQRIVPPPMPGNGNITSLRPMNEQPLSAWLSSSSCVSRPKEQPLSSSSVIAREQGLSAWFSSSSCASRPKEHHLSSSSVIAREQGLSPWLESSSCLSRPKEQPLSSSSFIAREQGLSPWLESSLCLSRPKEQPLSSSSVIAREKGLSPWLESSPCLSRPKEQLLSSSSVIARDQGLSAWLESSSCVSRPKEHPMSVSSVIAREKALSAWLESMSLPANMYRLQMATGLVQPMTTKDHAVRKLIREHGKHTDDGETNQNPSVTGSVNRGNNGNKVRKKCIYFGTARGCRNGDACLFLHDRAEAPMAKKMKCGRYK